MQNIKASKMRLNEMKMKVIEMKSKRREEKTKNKKKEYGERRHINFVCCNWIECKPIIADALPNYEREEKKKSKSTKKKSVF